MESSDVPAALLPDEAILNSSQTAYKQSSVVWKAVKHSHVSVKKIKTGHTLRDVSSAMSKAQDHTSKLVDQVQAHQRATRTPPRRPGVEKEKELRKLKVSEEDASLNAGTPLRYGAHVLIRSYKNHFLYADRILGIGVKEGEPDSSCKFKVVNLDDPTSHSLVEYGTGHPVWLETHDGGILASRMRSDKAGDDTTSKLVLVDSGRAKMSGRWVIRHANRMHRKLTNEDEIILTEHQVVFEHDWFVLRAPTSTTYGHSSRPGMHRVVQQGIITSITAEKTTKPRNSYGQVLKQRKGIVKSPRLWDLDKRDAWTLTVQSLHAQTKNKAQQKVLVNADHTISKSERLRQRKGSFGARILSSTRRLNNNSSMAFLEHYQKRLAGAGRESTWTKKGAEMLNRAASSHSLPRSASLGGSFRHIPLTSPSKYIRARATLPRTANMRSRDLVDLKTLDIGTNDLLLDDDAFSPEKDLEQTVWSERPQTTSTYKRLYIDRARRKMRKASLRKSQPSLDQFAQQTYLKRVEAEATALEAMVPVSVWSILRRQAQLLEEERRERMAAAVFRIQRAVRRWTAGRWRRRLQHADVDVKERIRLDDRQRRLAEEMRKAPQRSRLRQRSQRGSTGSLHGVLEATREARGGEISSADGAEKAKPRLALTAGVLQKVQSFVQNMVSKTRADEETTGCERSLTLPEASSSASLAFETARALKTAKTRIQSGFITIDHNAHLEAKDEFEQHMHEEERSRRNFVEEARKRGEERRRLYRNQAENMLTAEGRRRLDEMRVLAKREASLEDIQELLRHASMAVLDENYKKPSRPNWIPTGGGASVDEKWYSALGLKPQDASRTRSRRHSTASQSSEATTQSAGSVRSFDTDAINEFLDPDWSIKESLSILQLHKPHLYRGLGTRGSMLRFLMTNVMGAAVPPGADEEEKGGRRFSQWGDDNLLNLGNVEDRDAHIHEFLEKRRRTSPSEMSSSHPPPALSEAGFAPTFGDHCDPSTPRRRNVSEMPIEKKASKKRDPHDHYAEGASRALSAPLKTDTLGTHGAPLKTDTLGTHGESSSSDAEDEDAAGTEKKLKKSPSELEVPRAYEPPNIDRLPPLSLTVRQEVQNALNTDLKKERSAALQSVSSCRRLGEGGRHSRSNPQLSSKAKTSFDAPPVGQGGRLSTMSSARPNSSASSGRLHSLRSPPVATFRSSRTGGKWTSTFSRPSTSMSSPGSSRTQRQKHGLSRLESDRKGSGRIPKARSRNRHLVSLAMERQHASDGGIEESESLLLSRPLFT